MPAQRLVGDRTNCDGKISAGSPNVFIGGETEQTEEITPEVLDWLHNAIFGLGFGSAVILSGSLLAVLGLAGGIVGDRLVRKMVW